MQTEIDLLKMLKHPNIVVYRGCVKSEGHLNIILEFVDCGSLAQIVDKFGKLPESLVAGYIGQVSVVMGCGVDGVLVGSGWTCVSS